MWVLYEHYVGPTWGQGMSPTLRIHGSRMNIIGVPRGAMAHDRARNLGPLVYVIDYILKNEL